MEIRLFSSDRFLFGERLASLYLPKNHVSSQELCCSNWKIIHYSFFHDQELCMGQQIAVDLALEGETELEVAMREGSMDA
jgi:hypothetical protein